MPQARITKGNIEKTKATDRGSSIAGVATIIHSEPKTDGRNEDDINMILVNAVMHWQKAAKRCRDAFVAV